MGFNQRVLALILASAFPVMVFANRPSAFKLRNICAELLSQNPEKAMGKLLFSSSFAYDYEKFNSPEALSEAFIAPSLQGEDDSKDHSSPVELVVWEAIVQQAWYPSEEDPSKGSTAIKYIAKPISEIRNARVFQVTAFEVRYYDHSNVSRRIYIDPTFDPNEIEKHGPFLDSLDLINGNAAVGPNWTGQRVVGYFITSVVTEPDIKN